MPAPPRNSSSAGPNRNRSNGVEQPPGARHDAVPAAVRQVPGKHLEDGPAVGRAAAQRGLQHGQLILVGQQGGTKQCSIRLGSIRLGRVIQGRG